MDLRKARLVLSKMISFKDGNNLGYGNELLKSLILLDSHKLILDPSNEMIFKLSVNNQLCNLFGTMHGGAIATLVDVSTTVFVSAFDRENRHNVSVELTTQYLNPIKNNSSILVHCKIPKTGKTLAYSYADIYDEESLKIAAKSSHIKAFLDKKWEL